MNKEDWIENLGLLPHPEGGYYKETYRSNEKLIPDGMEFERDLSTAIYFLLEDKNFSAFHRIKSDELWHHYDGNTIIIHVIDVEGNYSRLNLGKNLKLGEKPQLLVEAGSWFASEVQQENGYALVGCTVSFGFDFDDFELADKSLVNQFPQHKAVLNRLIR